MFVTNSYVQPDEHGVLRVGGSRIMLDSVVAAFHDGHSAETIRQQYPAASLEEIYGAITYYLANASEVDEYLRRQEVVWAQRRAGSTQHASPVIERLRAMSSGVPRQGP